MGHWITVDAQQYWMASMGHWIRVHGPWCGWPLWWIASKHAMGHWMRVDAH